MASTEEILTKLLDCWCDQLADHPLGAPAECCIVTAVDFADCCGGRAWVRLVGAYPSVNFPQPAGAAKCRIDTWALQVEIGVMRCAPDSCGGVDICCQSETEAVLLGVIPDFERMRRVFTCGCLEIPADEIIVGQFVPEEPEGTCIATTMQATIRVSDSCTC